MSIPRRKAYLHVLFLGGLFFTGNVAEAQEYTQRLRSPAAVKGLIGGESHNSYVIRARKGQVMTVRISWRRERSELGDNHAEFYVSELPDFGSDGAVKFGKDSADRTRWSGKIPRTKNYYIYVMAHPTAYYTMKVMLR